MTTKSHSVEIEAPIASSIKIISPAVSVYPDSNSDNTLPSERQGSGNLDVVTVASKLVAPSTPKKSGIEEANTLLNALWPSSDRVHQIGTIDRQIKRYNNIPVKSIEEAVELAFAKSNAGLDSYFACAEYIDANSRTAANAYGAGAFWMDFDCGEDKAANGKGYINPEAAIEALNKFCEVEGLPKPTHIASSGGGIHAYWSLSYSIVREVWQEFARKLKKLTSANGLLVDDARTADIASVLRIPGTYNHKYKPPRLVTLISSEEQPIDSSVMLGAIDHAANQLVKAGGNTKAEGGNPSVASANSQYKKSETNVANIRAMLTVIDPDCSRSDWIKIGMAIFHESAGSEEGFELWDTWSKKGEKYCGRKELYSQWQSFNKEIDNPITIATVIKMVTDSGFDWMDVVSASEPFEVCTSVIEETLASNPVIEKANPLDQYSLRGRSAEIERNTADEVFILGEIALSGQFTVIYASPNTGKTLITLHLIIQGIKCGNINSSKLYYLNMDDTSKGLLQKLHLAEEYGFHVLSEGHLDFNVNQFLGIVNKLIEDDQCSGVVIVLDTLKKFTNLMNKESSSAFSKVIRRFIVKGGTLIALAHTNKKPGADGKPVYGGTTDIIDDADCAYTIAPLVAEANEKVVEFTNIKRRGNVAMNAAYSYTLENNAGYNEILLSVRSVDPEQIEIKKHAEALKSDAEVITAIRACIQDGTNTKMKLAEAVADLTGISKRSALKIIERHTGSDPATHLWSFTVQERGAKVFCNIEVPQT